MLKKIHVILFLLAACVVAGCQKKEKNTERKLDSDDKQSVASSLILPDSEAVYSEALRNRIDVIRSVLKQQVPVILFTNPDTDQKIAQDIALKNKEFQQNWYDKKSKQAFRNEIFNIYPARPQEIPEENQNGNIYKVEMYNYALNLTTTAFVDIKANSTIQISTLAQTQPDIPAYLKDLATSIAANHPEVIKALGYKPGDSKALMANTKTALNDTKCERSLHLCVAPTFLKDDKALWVIVDLTDFKVVGIRWTNTGTSKYIGERKLKFDKIMECYCKQISHVDKDNWKFNYVITTSDGLRISEVQYRNRLIVNSAKVVDWHVSYSNTDGFGYSDAVGCPEFSQAAVVAVSAPRISDIVENGKSVGFALEQNFSSQQWPVPCNYNYLQRYEFYNDGRFRPIAASLGRGCGNNGTYRPVTRISFAGNNNTISEWSKTVWMPWTKEGWKLQNSLTSYTQEGYQYKISDQNGSGFFLEPGQGQFGDGGRGDNAYLYVTKQHADRDEGENDLVTIGPCCNTDYQQGPEKFIDKTPEEISNTSLVVWYVAQMKNDDTRGREYCWAESYLDNGVYKTKIFPCLSGPMFTPLKK